MSIFVNIGMWFERFVIIATTLARDYLPSSWSYYWPSWVEIGIYVGTFRIVLHAVFGIRKGSPSGSHCRGESNPEAVWRPIPGPRCESITITMMMKEEAETHGWTTITIINL
jgi:hypothetical protein